MLYRRMPIEIESPEQLGYDRIDCNLAESSCADVRYRDLGIQLDDLVLAYQDHLGHPPLRALIAHAHRLRLADFGRSAAGPGKPHCPVAGARR